VTALFSPHSADDSSGQTGYKAAQPQIAGVLMNTDAQNVSHAPSTQRQLVLLCDGTSNSVDVGQGTNVLRMLSTLQASDAQQLVFYDPGVGSPSYAPETTWLDKSKQMAQRLMGLAFGKGVFENIAQAYEFLMREYREGDEIYVLGFSRGAFTARAVVGMVNAFGLLPAHSSNLLPMLLNVYFTQKDPLVKASSPGTTPIHRKRTRQVLVQKVRENNVPPHRRDITVHFVGIWDTVATLGIPPLDQQIPVEASLTFKDAQGQSQPKKFRHVRHALALDEQRVMFKPRVYVDEDRARDAQQPLQQSIIQRWFPGAHCDVGGTYADNAVISQAAFMWLLQEACDCGLRLSAQVLQTLSSLPQNPTDAMGAARPLIHSELYDTPYWAIAGMCVRQAQHGASFPFGELQYPQDTVWQRRRSAGTWLLALLGWLLFYGASGWAALGYGLAELGQASAWWQACHEPLRMALWQLQAVLGSSHAISYGANAHLKTALVWDCLMVPCYAYIAARLMTRAFASLAGLNRLNAKPRRLLNVLGLGLTVLVAGDLLENIATLVWLAWPAGTWSVLLWLNALLVSLFSLIKFAGLGLRAALLLWAACQRGLTQR
jgi:uncharacterized protein (DUF2235 family)